MQMICHGLSTGALFVLAGGIQERLHTRELGRLGGLHAVAPRMSLLALCFALASLGLPGLGNFVAELLVLLGAFEASPAATVAAAIGLVPATVYSLWILQRVFHGPLGEAVSRTAFRDLSWRELATQPATSSSSDSVESRRRKQSARCWRERLRSWRKCSCFPSRSRGFPAAPSAAPIISIVDKIALAKNVRVHSDRIDNCVIRRPRRKVR